jgi:hypothetical protein
MDTKEIAGYCSNRVNEVKRLILLIDPKIDLSKAPNKVIELLGWISQEPSLKYYITTDEEEWIDDDEETCKRIELRTAVDTEMMALLSEILKKSNLDTFFVSDVGCDLSEGKAWIGS